MAVYPAGYDTGWGDLWPRPTIEYHPRMAHGYTRASNYCCYSSQPHTQPPPGHGCSFKSWLHGPRVLSNPFIRSPKGTHSRGSDYLDRHAAVNVKAVYSQYVSAECDTLYGAPSHSLTHQAVIRGGGICGPARDAERCVASFQLSYVQ
jgi:hypothetical protein